MSRPRLAVLFWFYKAFDVCRSRLRLLRDLNPGVSIYGLYGGPLDQAAEAASLAGLLDDLYLYQGPENEHWKWINGDHLIAAWARDRGPQLEWDTVVVVQWDMLVLAPVAELFAMLREGEALFSGFRPLSEVEAWWGWARRDQPERRSLLDRFLIEVFERYGYAGSPFVCLFIVVCLPRRFLERYAAEHPPEGFLEYRMPTMARVFDTPVRLDHPFQPWWASEPGTRDAPPRRRLLNAADEEPALGAVLEELANPGGARLIHPVRGPFDPSLVHAERRGS